MAKKQKAEATVVENETQTTPVQEPVAEVSPREQKRLLRQAEKEKAKAEKEQLKAKKAKQKKEKKTNKFVKKVKETGSELKKVTWPSFSTVVKNTGIVLAFVLISTVVLFGFEYLLGLLYNLFTKSL